MRGAYLAEGISNPSNPEKWRNMVYLTQYMWQNREIPTDLGCTIIAPIPKINTDTRGVGLLETLCKLVEAIIDTCLKACIRLHDIIYGFRAVIGTGTSIIELKISQDLASIDQ